MTDTLFDRIARLKAPWIEARGDLQAAFELLADCQQRIQELESLRCPFCGENDFDLEGLDNHLHRYCEKYGGLHAQEQCIQKLEEKLREAKEKIQELEELNEKRITDYRQVNTELQAAKDEFDHEFDERTKLLIQLKARDEELKALKDLIRKAQRILTIYLPPDSGISEHECVNQMLGLLDGPECRKVLPNE